MDYSFARNQKLLLTFGKTFLYMHTGNFLEDEISEKIKNGDRQALGVLFDAFYSPLCAYAITFIKISDKAEEMVQECFVRIWENHANIDIQVSWKAYLYRTVHNQCINYLKNKEVIKRQSEEYLKEITHRFAILQYRFDESEFDPLVTRELEISLHEVVESLPAQCKEIFILSRSGNLSYSEIARKLNVSVSTVKTQMVRAFDRLRQVLKKN